MNIIPDIFDKSVPEVAEHFELPPNGLALKN